MTSRPALTTPCRPARNRTTARATAMDGEIASFLSHWLGGPARRGFFLLLENHSRIRRGEEMHDPRDGPGPARLVARADSRPCVPVEIFIEQGIIPPMGIFLEFSGSPVHGPSAHICCKGRPKSVARPTLSPMLVRRLRVTRGGRDIGRTVGEGTRRWHDGRGRGRYPDMDGSLRGEERYQAQHSTKPYRSNWLLEYSFE